MSKVSENQYFKHKCNNYDVEQLTAVIHINTPPIAQCS
jgi:hypothetical protein